jgi:hypothetical protein
MQVKEYPPTTSIPDPEYLRTMPYIVLLMNQIPCFDPIGIRRMCVPLLDVLQLGRTKSLGRHGLKRYFNNTPPPWLVLRKRSKRRGGNVP